MGETEYALLGTTYLAPARRTAFYDFYQKQYAQTLAWLQRAVAEAAVTRDHRRRSDATYKAELRRRLAQFSGTDQISLSATQVEQSPTAGGATAYQVQSAGGLLYTGLLWEPAPATSLRGVVILGGEDAHTTEQLISHYHAQGLRVIVPCLARTQHSFKDHPSRHWYYFTDDELLHLFFFVCGGSLAGLEAAELLTITQALGRNGEEALPVALHLGGRHLLSAAVAAALAPGQAGIQPYQLLVLPQTVAALDHQETDQRVNTIWNFHSDFDALTLLDLADADLLFLDGTPTPAVRRRPAVTRPQS